MITTLAELAPQPRAAVEEYLAAVAPTVDAEFRSVVLCDLRAWLGDHLDADATLEQVQELLDRAGPVEPEPEPEPEPEAAAAPRAPGRGTVGGVPFDVRPPTAERILRTMWAPTDPRLFLPRSLGIGWDLNFGALAVRLGLIEPDAEDVPFASVPEPAFRASLALPAALAVATVAHYAVRGPALPGHLPSHFDAAGRPDRWAPKGVAAATDVALAVLPTAWAVWAVAAGRPVSSRVAALALAAGASGGAAGLAVARTAALDGRARPWAGPFAVAVILAPVGGTLLGLARAGRRAELRRDLGRTR